MNTAGKLAAYGAAVVLVAAGAYAVGSAVGPLAGETAAPAGHGGDGHRAGPAARPKAPTGLASTVGGYTFVPASTTLDGGEFAFRITGPDGRAVTGFDVAHDKRMHLIVVRRDLVEYQHVHPEQAPDGTWTVPLEVGRPGAYRAFADFDPEGGDPVTLGVDLFADGDAQRVAHANSTVDTVDGYEVRLDGELSAVTATVTKDGVEVTDLEPYLGAYGHLVALREGDLAYLHVHPDGAPGDGRTAAGPRIGFGVEVPSAGKYRLFLDFKHGGVVRTADFTVTADGAGEHGHG
ncbi:hypothetical protein GCM10023148_52740 [Actinokineospora soli]